LPQPDAGQGPKSGLGSWAWGVNAKAKNAAAAGKFLDYLASDAAVTEMTDATGAPPATQSVTKASKLYGEGGPLALFSEQLRKTCGGIANRDCVAVVRPVTPGYPVISSQFAKAFEAIYKGGDAEAALDQAAKAIDLDFKDNENYDFGS
ncbi:MAG: sugar ABC transporter substrate-binding protein, partial [Actinomycetota bacterium]